MKQIVSAIILILFVNVVVCPDVLAEITVKQFDPPQEEVLPDGTRAWYNREEISSGDGIRVRYYTERIQWGQKPLYPTAQNVRLMLSETSPEGWTSYTLMVDYSSDYMMDDSSDYIDSWPGAKITVDDILKRGLIKPRPHFIDWVKICHDFNPDTGEFEAGYSPDYASITNNPQLRDTVKRVRVTLIPDLEEGEIIVNSPDRATANKKICALLHERAETTDNCFVPTYEGTMGIQRIDPILSLPNVEQLAFAWHSVQSDEIKKVVVLPKLRSLAYNDCRLAPKREDYPYYPGPHIMCEDSSGRDTR